MKEIWKDIIGYEGIYQISNFGNVRKIAPFSKCMNCSVQHPYIMKLAKSSTGYIHVQLCKDGIPHTINIHKLVATAFVPNPYNKPEINHIDANRANNKSSNLEWVYHTENIIHSIKLGNINPYLLHKNERSHGYSVLQYSLDGKFIKEWNCIKDIVNSMNIKYSAICACLNGNHKSSFGYIWVKHYKDQQINDYIQPRISMTGKNQNKKKRKIGQYDKQGNLIYVWNSYLRIRANKSFGEKSLANIMKCANGKRKSANGYIWKYM